MGRRSEGGRRSRDGAGNRRPGAGPDPTRGDSLAGPADSTRPRNPWPRLLAFFAVVAISLVLVGVCVASFASPPPRDLRLPATSLDTGVPRFYPVIPFGADRAGMTYGAWVASDGEQVRAYLARHPASGCRIDWGAPAPTEETSRGAFVDPCGDDRYAIDGRALTEDAPRDLDQFPVRIESGEVIVDIERLRLGECRNTNEACSPPGEARFVEVPGDELPENFVAPE